MSSPEHEFDAYAVDYDEALNRGLSLSGERKDFFAVGRVVWTLRQLKRRGWQRPEGVRILDYGCGTGSAVPHFLEHFSGAQITGVDVSTGALEVARGEFSGAGATFVTVEEFTPRSDMDLAFTNGTFHHIPLDERDAAMQAICSALKPGGWFAFWENNPWSPAARLVMARIPFDRDAVMVWPVQARRLASAAGFHVHTTDFRFIFPGPLGFLRPVELFVTRLPLGAQYLILCRKGTDGG